MENEPPPYKPQSLNELWGVSDEKAAQMRATVDNTFVELSREDGVSSLYEFEHTIITRINPQNMNECVVATKYMRDRFWTSNLEIDERETKLSAALGIDEDRANVIRDAVWAATEKSVREEADPSLIHVLASARKSLEYIDIPEAVLLGVVAHELREIGHRKSYPADAPFESIEDPNHPDHFYTHKPEEFDDNISYVIDDFEGEPVEVPEFPHRFPLGECQISPIAKAALEEVGLDPKTLFMRHGAGDWGDQKRDGWLLNEQAIHADDRLLSIYVISDQEVVYVETRGDRATTRLYMSFEY